MVAWGAHSHPQSGSPVASRDTGTCSLQLVSPETMPRGSVRLGADMTKLESKERNGLGQVETWGHGSAQVITLQAEAVWVPGQLPPTFSLVGPQRARGWEHIF